MTAAIRTSEELRRYAATDAREPIADVEFRDELTKLLDHAPEGLVRGYAFFSLPAELSTWLDTGIDCELGEAVTLLTTSRVRLPSPEAEAQISPDLQLWNRVLAGSDAHRGVFRRVGADGPPMRGARSSDTFVAPSSGRLFLASQMNAAVAARLDDATVPRVDRCTAVLRWAGDPLEGLEVLRAGGDVGGVLDSEIARQHAAIQLPDGWFHTPEAGPSDQFVGDGRGSDGAIIGCYSRDSGALLLTNAALPFLPGTTLRWAWKMDQLPSGVGEDRLQTHDYLSIAVEFDNGRDLTYYWSAELPVEAGYHCPVPGWENRETHVVVRSGPDGLGQWLDEERDLYADYARHVGDPPANIVRVWLLAVTFFQGNEGECQYGRIELENDSARVRVN